MRGHQSATPCLSSSNRTGTAGAPGLAAGGREIMGGEKVGRGQACEAAIQPPPKPVREATRPQFGFDQSLLATWPLCARVSGSSSCMLASTEVCLSNVAWCHIAQGSPNSSPRAKLAPGRFLPSHWQEVGPAHSKMLRGDKYSATAVST